MIANKYDRFGNGELLRFRAQLGQFETVLSGILMNLKDKIEEDGGGRTKNVPIDEFIKGLICVHSEIRITNNRPRLNRPKFIDNIYQIIKALCAGNETLAKVKWVDYNSLDALKVTIGRVVRENQRAKIKRTK